MSTVYDEVARDARDDHRHNPPGFASRPVGRRTAPIDLPTTVVCDTCSGELLIDPDSGMAVPCPECCPGDTPDRYLPSDEVLTLWAEEHAADRQAGAFADGPEAA